MLEKFPPSLIIKYNRGEATENYTSGVGLAEARNARKEGQMGSSYDWESECELNGTRDERRSWSIAGRGVAKWGSRNHEDVKREGGS